MNVDVLLRTILEVLARELDKQLRIAGAGSSSPAEPFLERVTPAPARVLPDGTRARRPAARTVAELER